MNIEYLTLIPAIFELSGIALLVYRNRLGFYSNVLSNLLWITYVCLTNNAHGLLLVSSVAIFINISGIIKWSKT